MNDAELRRRIADADPSTGTPVPSLDDPSARALLEDIMNTPLDTTDTTDTTATTAEPDTGATRSSSPRRWAPVAGIAAAGALVIGGLAAGGAFGTADDEPEVATPVTTAVAPDEPMTLSLGEGQDALASCMRLDPEVLRPVQVAFAGDVRSIDGEIVTIDVTRWYTGGDAAAVEMVAPAGLEALIGSVDFEVGGSYLISSGDGQVVNYCGWSGRATPELQAIYDAAFPG